MDAKTKVPIYTSDDIRGPGNPVILTHGRRHVWDPWVRIYLAAIY